MENTIQSLHTLPTSMQSEELDQLTGVCVPDPLSLSLSLPPSHSPRAHRLASLAPHCFCRGSALDLHDDRPSNASKRSPFFSLLASSRRLLLPLLLSCQSAAAFLSFLFVTTDAQDMHTQAAPLASLIYQSCVVNSAIVETKKERKRSSVAALMP